VYQSIGFVPQFFSSPFAYSVLDIVLMGRSTHINTFAKPKPHDYQIAMQALDYLNLTHLENREFASLSGGAATTNFNCESHCFRMQIDTVG
jgi:uncharacterized ABC transporter ATP-binding protein HI_1470